MAIWTCAEEVKRNKEKREQIFSFVKVFNNINRNKKYPVVLTPPVVFHCVIYCVTHLTHKVNFYLLWEKKKRKIYQKIKGIEIVFRRRVFLFVVREFIYNCLFEAYLLNFIEIVCIEFRYYYWNSERDFFVLRKKRNKRERKSWKIHLFIR